MSMGGRGGAWRWPAGVIRLAALLWPAALAAQNVVQREAAAGVVDLRGHNWAAEPVVQLAGDFEFYWQALLEPADFLAGEGERLPGGELRHFPNLWNGWTVRPAAGGPPEIAGGHGYATLRVRLLLDEQAPARLALQLNTSATAHRAYLGQSLLLVQGRVGQTPESSVAAAGPGYAEFERRGLRTLDLVLQISNFEHRSGGLWYAPALGVPAEVQRFRNTHAAVEMLAVGAMLLASLYHLGLFARRRRDRATLYFGLTTLLMALRLATQGQMLVVLALQPPFWAFLKTEYLSTLGAVCGFFYFVSELFPAPHIGVARRIFLAVTLACAAWVVVGDSNSFSYSIFVIHPLVLGGVVYVSYLGLRALRRRQEHAGLFLVGFAIVSATAINDILHQHWIVRTGYVATYGLIAFVFFQSVTLSRRLSGAFNLAEELTQRLEQKVAERTAELSGKNQTITESIDYARRIHLALFSTRARLQELLPEHFWLHRPKDIVSGDFLWLRPLPGGEVMLALADCTGHGVPAAFLSLVGHAHLTQLVVEQRLTSPAQILRGMDALLRETLRTGPDAFLGEGMDVLVARVEPAARRLVFCGAQQPLLVVQPPAPGQLPECAIHVGTRFSVGGRNRRGAADLADQTLLLEPGSMVYLGSDGLADQDNAQGLRLTQPRLRALLAAVAHLPPPAQLTEVERALDAFQGGHPQRDDISLLGLRL